MLIRLGLCDFNEGGLKKAAAIQASVPTGPRNVQPVK